MREALRRRAGSTLVPLLSDDGPPLGPAIIGSRASGEAGLGYIVLELANGKSRIHGGSV